MIDHSQVKLGKKAARVDTRTLKLSRYFLATLPPPPPSCDFSHSQDEWGVMMNDELGNCTIAAVAHAVQTWTQVINQEITVPDQVVVDYYSRWCGYMRGIDSTDNGGVELDVLNNWRRDTFAGHQLLGYADADPTNLDHVKQAVALFGGDKGTELYAPLIAQAAALLKPGGLLVLELGHNSAQHVSCLLAASEWTSFAIANDLAGIPRVASARRN